MNMEAVPVWEELGVRRVLTSVEDAALFLLHEWPMQDRGSKSHIAAQVAVLQAIEQKIPPEDARAAFVKAAERVQVLAPALEMPTHKLPPT